MFEEKNSYISSAKWVYERAVEFFGEDNNDDRFVVAFAKFQEGQKEHERARLIYKYALDHLPKDSCQEIFQYYTVHEKKFVSRAAIEDVIVIKRKFKYEEKANNKMKEKYVMLKNIDQGRNSLMLEILNKVETKADNGDEEARKHVDKLMPQKIKKRRKIQTEDGSDAGWEEYHDYIFPDEEASQPNLKLLAMAKKWKQQMEDDEES